MLDLLRGLAAVAVMWFHVTNGSPDWPWPEPIRRSGAYGWLGVQAFFVISGFVVPLSMHAVAYRVPRWHRFLARRVVRLDPPYVVAILMCLGLTLAPALLRGTPHPVSLAQVVAHLGYANALLGYPWLNPVFWTLAIEFQFYCLMALAFPLLSHPAAWVRLVSVVLLAGTSFLPFSDAILTRHLTIFMLGVLAYQQVAVSSNPLPIFVAGSVVLGVGVSVRPPVEMVVGVLTAVVIVAARSWRPWRGFVWLGTISYSLYLLHGPIVGRIVTHGLQAPSTAPRLVVTLVGSVIVSVVSAYLLHRFVERPAQRWSRRIAL